MPDRDHPQHPQLSDFDLGFFVGLLVGEGSFTGDGKRAQVALKMHINHRNVFDWLMQRFPASEFYGPYLHNGRHSYVWLARGRFLKQVIVPLLDQYLREEHSERVWLRYRGMKRKYGL